MTPADLLSRLDTIPAAQPPGLALVLELEQSVCFDDPEQEEAQLADLIERQGEIEEALCNLASYTNDAKQVIKRCLACPPIPSSTPPAGL